MTTLLVANRGEIALRIFRTARRLGLRCVAVHSDADADAPFVRAADLAVRIGPASAADSYLRRDRILEAARETGAELIHPGYGFLAEDPAFAKDCEDLGFTFVGPPSDVLRAMGDKAEAKRIAGRAGVPTLAGYAGDDPSDEALDGAAARIGYPVLVKPAAGGGGKGMTIVREPHKLEAALASARRVAQSAFGDDRLLLERYLEHPRHVEVQVLADHHGNVIHLGERDCSLQRRHQKILEESPSPAVDDELRGRLCDAAVTLATAAGYRNAGTCEFLLAEDGTFGFIEMNARLQVEHPVTEAVTGLDLVELQLGIARGEPLPIAQDDVRFDGHAIEVRVYAEDPDTGFLPQAGRIAHLRWPQDCRVDAGIEEGSDVPTHYDPLVAKIVVHGPDRVAALWALHRALPEAEVLGIGTNISFLRAVTQDTVVLDGKVTTDWLEHAYRGWRSSDLSGDLAKLVLPLAAAAEADRILASRDRRDPFSALGPWHQGAAARVPVVLRVGSEEIVFPVEVGDGYRAASLRVGRGEGCHEWWVASPGTRGAAVHVDGGWEIWLEGRHEIGVGPAERRLEAAGPAHLGSPLPGQVIAVRVAPGDRVDRNQELVVVEAMKMEHSIRAPAEGTVTAVRCREGEQVDRGQALVDLEPD